jgi:hypothetical protein
VYTVGMKKTNGKIYVTENFKQLVHMHRSHQALAKRFGVYTTTMSSAIAGKPVQASFVANVMLTEGGIPFESLFEVRR